MQSTRFFRTLQLAGVLAALGSGTAQASYPFEGTWILADRVCAASITRARTYSAKEVVSPLGRCAIRRISSGTNTFELLEECRRNDRAQSVTETIRLSSPDSMTLRRQISRLKIPRPLRYVRCTVAGTAAAPPAAPRAKPPSPRDADD